jgi:hypothetical protein
MNDDQPLRLDDLERKLTIQPVMENRFELEEGIDKVTYVGVFRKMSFKGPDNILVVAELTKYNQVYKRKGPVDIKEWVFSTGGFDYSVLDNGELEHRWKDRLKSHAAHRKVLLSDKLFEVVFGPMCTDIYNHYSALKDFSKSQE